MSNKLNQSISEILDIEPIEISEETPQLPVVVESNTPVDQIEDDSEFIRDNIKDLIKKGNTAIDQLLVVAKESEHPRAYEVVAGMLKNLSDLNKDLLDIHKKKKDLQPKKSNNDDTGNLSIDKAVFIGSTTDLIKMLKQSKKEQE